MGAHRITANFGEIEQKVSNYDKEKEAMKNSTKKTAGNDDADSESPNAIISSRFLMQELEKKVCHVVFFLEYAIRLLELCNNSNRIVP